MNAFSDRYLGGAGSTFSGIHNIEGVHSAKVGVNHHFNTPIVAKY
jgi:hypothetical protein